MNRGISLENGLRWSDKLGGVFWHLWMVAIVLTLALIAMPKSLVDAAACRLSPAYCARVVPQAFAARAPAIDSPSGTPQEASGRALFEAVNERYDAIKGEQDRLFSLIVALAALLTFLGFKGVHPDGHPNSPVYGHLKLPHLN